MKYIVTIVGLVGIIIIVGFVVNRDSAQAPAPDVSLDEEMSLSPQERDDAMISDETVIRVTQDGFVPADVTVKLGDTVKFVNDRTRTTWPASNDHPTHTIYPEFDPKATVAPGESWSFTFEQVGEWGYHDHVSPLDQGTITVTE